MTIFDLIFIVCGLVIFGALLRGLYLAARGRLRDSGRVFGQVGAGATGYVSVLIIVSLVTPARQVAPGEAHCFDDFCVTIDSASRRSAADGASRVIVSGRLTSRAARRRQRENGLYGMLIDDRGAWHAMSPAGQRDLEGSGLGGGGLNGFVEPLGQTPFKIAFDGVGSSRTVRFVARHGWFPGALIIGGEESLLHSPSAVELTVR